MGVGRLTYWGACAFANRPDVRARRGPSVGTVTSSSHYVTRCRPRNIRRSDTRHLSVGRLLPKLPGMPEESLQSELDARFAPLLDDLLRRAAVTETMIDKDRYRILMATLWAEVVLHPAGAGIDEGCLEPLHDVLNRRIAGVLGPSQSLTSCFRFLNGKAGDRAMKQARLTPEHRDLLLYFASMILDPKGHRRWMEELTQREPPATPR